MRTLHYLYIFTILSFLSCRSKTKELQIRNNEIKKISFATGGCYGHCPLLAIEIDSSLSFKFYGGEYTDKKGFYFEICSFY